MKDNYIKQGSILAGASLLVRIIGMLYRFPMSNIIGEEGNGLYSVAFEIYDVMLIISSYSIPLAISKMISAKRVKKRAWKYYENVSVFYDICIDFRRYGGNYIVPWRAVY